MIRDFLVNIALLTVFIFFAGQWFLKADPDTRTTLWYKLKVGIVMGVFGMVLLFAGVQVDYNILLDLRHQSVFVAACLGGLPASLTAYMVIIGVRMIMDFSSSLPAVATGLLIAIVSGITVQRIRSDVYRWLIFLSSFIFIFIVDLYWIYDFPFFRVVLPFLIINVVCGLFIAAFMIHLKRANGLLDQVRSVQCELLEILQQQPGYTLKFREVNGNLVYTMAEGQLLHLIGYDPVSMVGTSVLDGGRLPHDLAVFMHEHYKNAWGGEQITFEISFKGYTALATLQPIIGKNGQTIEVICSAVNITERKLAEKTLVENELKYRTIVDSSEDMIFGFEENGLVISANQKIVDVLDYPFKHIMGRTFPELFPGEHEQLWNHYFNQALTDRCKLWFELVMQMPDQHDHTFSVTLSPVFGEDGSFKSMTGTIHDLTDMIKKKEADEANAAKSQFLARMSHEIRTPLSGIIGITELMAKTDLTVVQRDYVSKIDSSSQALLHIINEILDFSKVEAGKLDLEAGRFHFATVIKKLSDTMSIFMGKQQIEIIFDTPANLPEELIGDSQRLEQVLLNLCGNAIKFTERGYVALRITVVKSFESGGSMTLRFEVEDTGIGISQEHIHHLFQPFSQADGSTSRKYGGTGLGLVISKSLIELMGGELSVHSELGLGSRFRFELSFLVPEDVKLENLSLLPRHIGRKAMVLEDSPLVYNQLRDYLASLQLEVAWVRSWKEAIALLELSWGEDSFDLVLADMEMDDMYGAETWQQLKVAAHMSDTLTLAMTSVGGRDELLGLGEDIRPEAILVKPINRNGLFVTLSAVLDHRGVYDESDLLVQAQTLSIGRNSSGRILLAEDNAINVMVATELLKEWGYYVEVAHNGVEVLKMLEEAKWDLVLMDIHMPEMDGFEVTWRIRMQPQYDQLPIIALTANVIKSDQDTYYRIGMNDIITKPIDVDAMRLTLRKWLAEGTLMNPMTGGGGVKQQLSLAAAAALPRLSGIQVGQALHRLDGKVMILVHLLKRFKQEYMHFVTDLQERLTNGEFEIARRMLHTFRGAAGNLSAVDLLAAATEVESALTSGDRSEDVLKRLLQTMEEEHRRVMNSIQGLQED